MIPSNLQFNHINRSLSNISKDALTEIETEISSYMMEAKKEYKKRDEKEDEDVI